MTDIVPANRPPAPPAMMTDLYQLTMAHGYWKTGLAEREAVFNLFYRRNPFGGGYTLACGLEAVIEFVGNFRFTKEDIAYLMTLKGDKDAPLFDSHFLDWLGAMRFTGDIDAMPEGTAAFPQEPLVRVRGPIAQCQLLETPLLNLINFQTLIATKAARVCEAARGEAVLEFGLRRAQGPDGGLSASRAAYIGGCAATSNVQAGQVFGIPVKGTHAHSWVMAFESEMEAFEAWAEAQPHNCVLLVDTYDSLEGARRAAEIGRRLKERGHRLQGIRLDSGDLAYLSIEARKILDAAGLHDAAILASNDLDEHIIASLKHQGAKITTWGVGTKLVTGYDQPALGGVYKMAAIRDEGGAWRYPVKLSEQRAKITTPGRLQVRRFRTPDGLFAGDAIYDEEAPPPDGSAWTFIDPMDEIRRKTMPREAAWEDVLVPVFRAGRTVYASQPLDAIRTRSKDQLDRLHAGIRRFVNPHEYPVGLERGLHENKIKLVLEARGNNETD